MGETRGGVQSEGRKIDRSLKGTLKLAKEYAKVSVDVEVVRRHRRSFNVDPMGLISVGGTHEHDQGERPWSWEVSSVTRWDTALSQLHHRL